MSRPSRRSIQQQQQHLPPLYAAVPQSPGSPQHLQQRDYRQPQFQQPQFQQPPLQQQQQQQQQQYRDYPSSQHTQRAQPSRTPSANSSNRHNTQQSGRGAIAAGVASGTIGAGYGPYSYNPNQAGAGIYANSKFSTTPSETSVVTAPAPNAPPQKQLGQTSTVPQYMWDKDPDVDDALHNPDPVRDRGSNFTLFSARGWANASALVVLVVGLIALFVGYPVIHFYTNRPPPIKGFNLGGINGSGQIPDLPGMRGLIDVDTPDGVKTRTGTDGKKYELVFSDEFNTDGRTFYPGDDAFWEAVDLHYWPTGDLEWYDPSAITTANGKLTITLTEQRNHDLNFMSGMLTTWNKLCFNTGYVEISISMPGSPTAPGLWPGAWSLGNLGRAGYGATTEGMWPYSYDSCDLGTFPNQTAKDGTPTAAATGGVDNGPLSYLPGQRLSACTCPGSDHPGPKTSIGRGVPEIDIIETQVDTDRMQGQVSQSFQCAPYNYQYNFNQDSPATTIYDSSITTINTYKGGIFQQAVSAVTDIDAQFYNDNAYATYAYEWWSDPNHRDQSYITWLSSGQKSWTVTSASVGPDATSQVSQRLIPEEPMYMILNLGLSPGFQKQDFKHLQFPSTMYIDYVRIYQREGIKEGITCDPSSRPTSQYIEKHLQAYTNPNLTTWASAGNTFPRNSLYHGC